jgi:WGR domain
MLTVLGGVAEFERELIHARTGEGRERGKERGVHMGRPPKLTTHQKRDALSALADGTASQADLARRSGAQHAPLLSARTDLFGGVLLMKEWGRIGARGRIVAERYDAEALAAGALQQQAERKRRRGYIYLLLIAPTRRSSIRGMMID